MAFQWLVVVVGATLLLYTAATLAVPVPRLSENDPAASITRHPVGVQVLRVVIVAGAYLIFSPLVEGLKQSHVGAVLHYLCLTIVVVAGAYFFALLFRRAWWSMTLAGCVAVAASLAWWVWPNWLTVNILTAMVVMAVLSAVAVASFGFQLALFLTGILVFQDVMNVYFGDLAARATQTVTQTRPIPSYFLLPTELRLDAALGGMMGAVDVFVPGLLVIVAAAVARKWLSPELLLGSLIGYAFGLTASIVVSTVWNAAQPGLLFICPAVVIGMAVATLRSREFRVMWRYSGGKDVLPADE